MRRPNDPEWTESGSPDGVREGPRGPKAPSELALHLLREVRVADEEEGGLVVSHGGDEDQRDALAELADLGLIEHRGRYGEAPDGEEDELDADADGFYRITPRGVELLRDLGMSSR